jgi:dTDP-4-dehydrorhamnose reductase
LKKYGLYHISSGERLSVFKIVCNIAECLKQDVSKINRIKSAELNQVARRPLDSTLNIEKAIKHFDFNPTKLNNVLNNIL